MKLKETKTEKGKTLHVVEVQETVTKTKEYDASELQNELVRLKNQKEILTLKLEKITTEIDNITSLQALI